jgi:hypothetical protein
LQFRIAPRQHYLDKRADNLIAADAGNNDDLLNTSGSGWLGISVQWLEIGCSKFK